MYLVNCCNVTAVRWNVGAGFCKDFRVILIDIISMLTSISVYIFTFIDFSFPS